MPADEVYIPEDQYGETQAYTLSGGDHSQYAKQVHMTTQVPTKTNRWRSVLKRKPTLQPPPVVETVPPTHDYRFADNGEEHYEYQADLPPVPDERSLRSSGSRGRAYSERSGVARHDTGRSRTVTILPHDSASNTHVEYAQHGVRPLQGIVEEKSDIDYQEPHVHRPRSPTITPLGVQNTGPRVYLEPAGDSVLQHSTGGSQAQVVHHDIGHGLHLHHRDKHHGRGMMPFQVTDAHGNKQHVQEVILNDSGVQEIPMPSHGNVIFIVEEGVTLDVKDPETGEYIPLEQYYANMAARRQPQQDQFVVVNGDASNVIVEDHNGNVLHRGSKVKDEFIHRPHSRSVSDRSHERRSHEEHFSARSGSLRSGSNHVRHEEGSVISE